jgi:hypothetical protein
MDGKSLEKLELKVFILYVDSQLGEMDCYQFSKEARSILRKDITKYKKELISEAKKIARQQKADLVSGIHVKDAASRLRCKPSKRIYTHLGTLGGVFLGASISTFLEMGIQGELYPDPLALLVPIFGMVGTFLITFNIAREL